MLKCQLHTHVHGDPEDEINFTAFQLIDRASSLNYEVLSITCHKTIVFDQKLQEYAKKKGILLIPGIEFDIRKKHILGINIDKQILKVDTFDKLKQYRTSHPNSLIIAAHPFFPGPGLGRKLKENIDCFDAIEYSWAYTKLINFNKKSEQISQKYSKPLIATSDCHVLDYLDLGFTEINSPKEINSIIKAIKENRIKNYTKPTSTYRIARSLGQVELQTILKKLRMKS